MDHEPSLFNLRQRLRSIGNKTSMQSNNKVSNTIGNQSMYGIMQFARWTPQEDAQLTQLVQQFGEGHWSQIASQMPNRSNRQCRERWVHYLSPNPRPVAQWTEEEDRLLLDKYSQQGAKWNLFAQFFPGRTAVQIKYRFSQLLGKRNQKTGADHEADAKRTMESTGYTIVQTQMRIRLQDGKIVIPDFAILMPGQALPENFDASRFDEITNNLRFIEAKSSDSAPFGPGQVSKLQALHDSGGTVMGGPFDGLQIPAGVPVYEERG